MITSGDADGRLRCVAIAAVSAAGAGLVLMAVRAQYAISLAEPLQLYTSGDEHGPLFALWRQIHHQPVYLDPHRIPFAPSYYNWLFFEVYAWIVGGVLHLLHLGEEWIPSVARLVTLGFAILGTGATWRTLLNLPAPATTVVRVVAAAMAAFVFFGPLAGFWAITLHPELPATAILALSVHRFCRLYPEHAKRAAFEFALLSYAAWGFKQLYVYGPGAVGLYLLLRRDWRALAVLVIVLPTLWAATLAVGSEDYVKVLLFRDTFVSFSRAVLLHNLGNALIKQAPVILALVALALVLARSDRARAVCAAVPNIAVFAFGLVVALAVVLPASAKIGAAENYYLPVLYFGTALAFAALTTVGRLAEGRPVALAAGAGWMLSVAVIAAVLAGAAGVLSTRRMDTTMRAVSACLARLPQPAFTTTKYAMLPWMHPGGGHYVLSYEYLYDRKAGRRFEAGGVGGLISAGHFGALLLSPSEAGFDGASMARYRRLPQPCAGLDVWLRRDLPEPAAAPSSP